MNIQIMGIANLKYCNKLRCLLKIDIRTVSNSQILCCKKRFKMKNEFKFQNMLLPNQTASVISDQKSVSPNLHNKETENKLNSRMEYDEYDHLRVSDHEIISPDLISRERISRQQYKKLSDTKKPSLTYQGEILYGVHPVHLALLQKKRNFYRLFTNKDIDSSDEVSLKAEIVQIAESMDIPVSYINSRGLKSLAPDAVHQGICLDAGFLPLYMWTEDLLVNDTAERNPLWLVLDEILDPMNVGAIIRSALYFGVSKLFTVRGNSCKLSPTVSKASSGSLEVMDIYQVDSLINFIKKRKDSGWSIVSTLAYSDNKLGINEPPINAAEFDTSKPTVLILGNEGKGISKDVLQLCDSLISIEPGQILPEGIDSLNVSVAAGVLLYILNSKARTVQRQHIL